MSRWTADQDVFADYRVDEQLTKALDRKVFLPSGGSLVIDRTEAMTVVDVNTGRFTGQGGNLEETVTKNNLEAAEEIVRQLRLRDIGGIIVIDFIDMVLESPTATSCCVGCTECLGRDRTKHQVAEVTSLGLVQMTRKRIGPGPARGVLRDLRGLQRPRNTRSTSMRRPRPTAADARRLERSGGKRPPTGPRRCSRRASTGDPGRGRRPSPSRSQRPSRAKAAPSRASDARRGPEAADPRLGRRPGDGSVPDRRSGRGARGAGPDPGLTRPGARSVP